MHSLYTLIKVFKDRLVLETQNGLSLVHKANISLKKHNCCLCELPV